MDMVSSENSNWLFDYAPLMEDIVAVPGGEFHGAATGFSWPLQPLNASPNASVEVECSYSESLKEVRSRKRAGVDCSSGDSDSIKEVGSRKSFLGNSVTSKMDMVSSENSNWLFDYAPLMEDIVAVPGGEFPGAATGFSWPLQPLNASPNASVEVECSYSERLKEVRSRKRVDVDCSSGDSDSIKQVGSRKRMRSESSGASSSTACREKLRRDRLKERFLELVAVMEPGRLPKTDKAGILSDAARTLTRLRSESHQLKETIDDLQEKIKEFKAEKNELRDERQRLREDKERLEQQVRSIAAQTSLLPHSPAISSVLTTQGQSTNKLMPLISYPGGINMWQMMPQTTLDASQDHVLRPPVA